jgi:hypothetical protein
MASVFAADGSGATKCATWAVGVALGDGVEVGDDDVAGDCPHAASTTVAAIRTRRMQVKRAPN